MLWKALKDGTVLKAHDSLHSITMSRRPEALAAVSTNTDTRDKVE